MSRWFRHYAGMARDDKIVRAALKAGQSIERTLWVWSAILESAAEIDDAGRYDLDPAEAAYFLRASVDDVDAVIAALAACGRIADGRVVKWGDRQFQSDRSAERQKRHREKQKAISDVDRIDEPTSMARDSDDHVTSLSRHGDAPETETELKTEEPSLRSGSTRPRPISPDWKPKDPGANPSEVKRFVAYNIAKGAKMADWDAAWDVWCSRQADYGEAAPPKAQGPPPEPQAWITEDDPRLPDLAARWEREHGRKPRVAGSRNQRGIGAYFPSEWLAQH